MIIGGLQKFSLLDYPDKISAIIFTQGCNFRCLFCYNPMLVWPKVGKIKNKNSSYEENQEGHRLSEGDLFDFLEDRKGKLQGVVITGGEPTIHSDLPNFIRKIKELDFLVKLDTNGTNPEMLERLIKEKLINYIAMDIKASPEKMNEVVGVNIDFKKIEKSVKIIMSSDLPYEFRTTAVPGLFSKDDIDLLGNLINGADNWFLQKFKSDIRLVNKKLEGKNAFTDREMEEFRNQALKYTKNCQLR